MSFFVRIFDSLRQTWANPDRPHGRYERYPASTNIDFKKRGQLLQLKVLCRKFI